MQNVDSVTLAAAIDVIDGKTLVIALQQSGIDQFGDRPAQIAFARCTDAVMHLLLDNRGCLTAVTGKLAFAF